MRFLATNLLEQNDIPEEELRGISVYLLYLQHPSAPARLQGGHTAEGNTLD